MTTQGAPMGHEATEGSGPPRAETAEEARLGLEVVSLWERLATAEAEWDAALDAKHAKLVEVADKLQAARERVTRAEALLGEFELSDEIDNRGDEDGTQCEPWWMCLHCGGPLDECDLIGTCLGARVRAFLAPTEPDGASGNRQGDGK